MLRRAGGARCVGENHSSLMSSQIQKEASDANAFRPLKRRRGGAVLESEEASVPLVIAYFASSLNHHSLETTVI